MPEDRSTLVLLVHVAIYAVAVAACAGVNLWLSPDNLWFVWVALGWGVAVATHALAYWLRHTRRRERVFIDCKARGATVHLFAYVATILLLFAVNLIVTPHVWWFYWVALGWGAGVAAHVWCAFFGKRRQLEGPPPAQPKASPKTRAAPKKTSRKKTAKKKTRTKKTAKKKTTPRKRPTR